MDSRNVFALRKEGKLQEAYNLASSLLNYDKYDEWNKRAMAWVLVDIIKIEIDNNIQNAIAYFNQLTSLDIQDDVLEKQTNYLKSKLTPINSEIEKATALSKSGQHLNALNEFHRIFTNSSNLFQSHYDAYGWAIYRYLRSESNHISSSDVKKILFRYNRLDSERPSLLHSQILKFVIKYVRSNQDIDIYRYFLDWGPSNLRAEDAEENRYEGKVYPSLLESLIKSFIYAPSQIDFDLLNQKIIVYHSLDFIEVYRESVFWQLFNLHKNKQFSELWQLFDGYSITYSKYGGSYWHSEILNLAQRFMVEDNLWRFPNFLHNWNVNNFQSSDWKAGTYNGKPTKSLVSKALTHVREYSKVAKSPKDLGWILPFYQEATENLSDDIWLLRGYSSLLSIMGREQEAIKIYNQVLLSLNNQTYAWHELANLIKKQNSDLAISMLCMAITKQAKEDFLGDIRLDLAEILIDKGRFDEAKRELTAYKKFRQSQKWKVSDRHDELYKIVESANSLDYDKSFYKNNSKPAEDYLHKDIEWQPFMIHRAWQEKKNNEEMIAITNLKDVELILRKSKFPALKESQVNDVICCKVHYDQFKDKYNILLAENSSKSYKSFIEQASTAIVLVDHVNHDKKLFHYYYDELVEGVIKFSDTRLRPSVGDFISIKYFVSFNKKFNKNEVKVVKVSKTSKTNTNLVKTIQGTLNLKYKHKGKTLEFENAINVGIDVSKPDFAFIEDFYVHRDILKKYNISSNRSIEATAIRKQSGWVIIDLDLSPMD